MLELSSLINTSLQRGVSTRSTKLPLLLWRRGRGEEAVTTPTHRAPTQNPERMDENSPGPVRNERRPGYATPRDKAPSPPLEERDGERRPCRAWDGRLSFLALSIGTRSS